MSSAHAKLEPSVGLILSGGGARAAYQVGVLQAIVGMLPDPAVNPFAIICGTSAGAINAASLAIPNALIRRRRRSPMCKSPQLTTIRRSAV